MTPSEVLRALRERTKELNCLYEVEKLLSQHDRTPEEVLTDVVRVIPQGWQYPEECEAEIELLGRNYVSGKFHRTPWVQEATVSSREGPAGCIRVYYMEQKPEEAIGPFLVEEQRLVCSLAERLGQFLQLRDGDGDGRAPARADWEVLVGHLKAADRALFLKLSRRMLNHLCSVGDEDAQQVLVAAFGVSGDGGTDANWETNVPGRKAALDSSQLLAGRPFELAAARLSAEEIEGLLRRWLQDEKIAALTKVLDNPRSPLPEVIDQVRRHRQILAESADMSAATTLGMKVSLIQRFLTDQIDFARTARRFLTFDDFIDLADTMVHPTGSHGKVGGKAAGLLLASSILRAAASSGHKVGEIRTPRSCYLATDGLLAFIAHNDLEDLHSQKFEEIDAVRREYPNIQQLMKNSPFPPEIVNGLAAALDEFGTRPLIVRSSSLLEDRTGTAFSGKYKSLFLANQGDKKERLEALLDAVAEIYASTFGPDPIAYRQEHGLLEFNEQMGLLIQEVVGTRLGRYYLPAFAGVAFSRTEFRWSARIEREDGLVRLVPGLGTRAVDRTRDDYPVLAVPAKPDLRVNIATDEVVRYAPRFVDVLDLEANTFVTLPLKKLLAEVGDAYPAFSWVFSLLAGDTIRRPLGPWSPEDGQPVATFDGLRRETGFFAQLTAVLAALEEGTGLPVDVEFAHDGRNFYLLQCRAQSRGADEAPAAIPRDVPRQDIVFSANRLVTNGWIPDVTHVVYVDPECYSALESREELMAVGRAVGLLNKLLPKRRFILMGPGRWGSRGDIKLGVSVTYADINNAAMLIEIARQRGSYVPEVSFGTHFFQDLVEARIRYLPLFPDDEGTVFNEVFLRRAPNLLAEMLPDYAGLADTVRVIDVPATRDGRILKILLNADLDEALGLLAEPDGQVRSEPVTRRGAHGPGAEEHWRWRQQMAERIAAEIDAEALSVAAIYLFGSVKNGGAGPSSDIDLLVHFRGGTAQRDALTQWLDGWSRALAEMNYMRTGYRSDGLLDVHLLTDDDIARKTSYAVKIGAVTDAAVELEMGSKVGGDGDSGAAD